MWSRTGDPLTDYEAYEKETGKKLEKLPICADCGEPIQDEYLYLINDEYICIDCLENNYKKNTEDFTE